MATGRARCDRTVLCNPLTFTAPAGRAADARLMKCQRSLFLIFFVNLASCGFENVFFFFNMKSYFFNLSLFLHVPVSQRVVLVFSGVCLVFPALYLFKIAPPTNE